MPQKSKTASSTPRLSEYARSFVYPSGICKTVWPRVEARGKELGLGFDWWQSQLGTVVLGYRKDGKYAATVGGVGMSIPRQVGKTYFVLAMLIIMCDLYPGLQVIWTSHHLQTSGKTFQSLQGLCRRKKIDPLVKDIRLANGEWRIVFTNGSLIRMGARSRGFGRGFDEIDVEVFDEAQILDTRALEDMIAATNQSRHEHGALLFFMGTPPRPLDPSEAFTDRREEALSGDSEDSVWLEIGADPKSDPNDRKQFPRMNPSFPKRTPLEAMQRLRRNLKNDESWNREGRGIWDDTSFKTVFSPTDWAECGKGERPAGLVMSGLAVAVASDLTRAAIVGAGIDEDGNAHVLPLAYRRGTAWVVDRAKELASKHDVDVVADSKSPASVLIPMLERESVPLRLAKLDDVCEACASLDIRIKDHRLRHGNDAALDACVEKAERKWLRDRWTWRRPLEGDIAVLEAATLAAWQASNPVEKKKSAYESRGLMTI